jgi:hypothetical protein
MLSTSMRLAISDLCSNTFARRLLPAAMAFKTTLTQPLLVRSIVLHLTLGLLGIDAIPYS